MAIRRWYPSKVDWCLAILLAAAPVATIAAWIGAVYSGNGVIAASIGLLVLAATYLGLVFPMRYGISDEYLVVRHGVVRQHIKLADITEVTFTHNPLSSPALSLDRIKIKFGAGFFRSAMISPAAKIEFLAELAERAKLHRDGDRLVSRRS